MNLLLLLFAAFQGAMDAREKELFTLTGRDERWDNFMLYTQGE